jgi:tetratricopeptide (TPR) repeat protein
MTRLFPYLKSIVTALLLTAGLSLPAFAQADKLDDLYSKLADPANPQWELTLSDILREWSKSGSPAMDLLLKRGQQAIEAGDFTLAIGHLTALTDHAPDFAEGWNARATAYFLAGQLGPSVDDIRRTLVLNPHHFGALSGLGMILEQTGKPDAALKAFRQSLAMNPHQEGIEAAVERLEQDATGTEL